jgi:hypothetical protein
MMRRLDCVLEIPRKHRGTEDPGNLAWTCVRCNLSKSSNLSQVSLRIGVDGQQPLAAIL